MADEGGVPLNPQIELAQTTLERAINDVCGVDVRKADTGELIRVEESLEAAALAAKDAVSLRLKRRTERRAGTESSDAIQAPDASDAEDHRVIDVSGTPWMVFGVYPSARSVEQGTLPDHFNHGWLSFEHGDEVRRYAPLPQSWQTLTDAALRALWEKAEVATRRITTIRPIEGSPPAPPTS